MDYKIFKNTVRVKVREKLNVVFSKGRRNRLKDPAVTIISNNCWGGHVYRYFGLPYTSPTVGLYFYADDYIKFCSRLKYYMEQTLEFISPEESKYAEEVVSKKCPIGKIDDIEIIFLHYKTQEEAREKWNRRKSRINWDNIVLKFSEQNRCCPEHVIRFDELPYERKLVFVTKDYGLKSQVLWGGECTTGNLINETVTFRDNVDLVKFLNGEKCGKRQAAAKKRLKRLQ